MHGIVRLKNGEYYDTEIFGYFCPIISNDDYQQYLQSIHNQYYLLLNKEKNRLYRQYVFDSSSKYLNPAILIVDADVSKWLVDEDGHGCIDFLSNLPSDAIEDELTPEQLACCIEMDASYHYETYPSIQADADIENLMSVSGWFHDACIEKCEAQANGTLYVLFDGIWGCKIEIWFSGEVAYCIKGRDSDEYNPYWYGSTVVIQDGFIYLVDEENMKVEDISDDYCWFKAKHMKYHVIPNKK